ncbi:MAG: DUF2442 domain-containing protein [Rhizobacter sp.]|nr:DUF2442 domain-containing protein [Bacteriovorax sp.]
MTKAIKVEASKDFTIIVSLEDGRKFKLDLSYIKNSSGPVVEPLKNQNEFIKAFIQDGIVSWSTGFDIDPYFILEEGTPLK